MFNIIKSNVLENSKCTTEPKQHSTLWIANNLTEKGLYNWVLKFLDTFAVLFVRFILAVCISVASEQPVNTLPAGTLELRLWAHGTIKLIAVVFTLSKPIASPGHRDTVNFPRETSKLLRRTRWGLFNKQRGGSDKNKVSVTQRYKYTCVELI